MFNISRSIYFTMDKYNLVNPDGTVILTSNNEQAITEVKEALIAYAAVDVDVKEVKTKGK